MYIILYLSRISASSFIKFVSNLTYYPAGCHLLYGDTLFCYLTPEVIFCCHYEPTKGSVGTLFGWAGLYSTSLTYFKLHPSLGLFQLGWKEFCTFALRLQMRHFFGNLACSHK